MSKIVALDAVESVIQGHPKNAARLHDDEWANKLILGASLGRSKHAASSRGGDRGNRIGLDAIFCRIVALSDNSFRLRAG